MSTINFIDKITVIETDWLNEADNTVHGILNTPREGAGDDLTITSTPHATKGKIIVGSNFFEIDEANGRVNIDNLRFDGSTISTTNTSGDLVLAPIINGNLNLLPSGTGRVQTNTLRASVGILFGTDTAAANTLDDYEKGTFTPALILTGGSVTYTTQTGAYIKCGDLVAVQIYIDISTVTTPSGTLEVSGLPFTASSGNKGAISIQGDNLETTAITALSGVVTPATANLRLYSFAAGQVANPGADLKATTILEMTAIYEV